MAWRVNFTTGVVKTPAGNVCFPLFQTEDLLWDHLQGPFWGGPHRYASLQALLQQ